MIIALIITLTIIVLGIGIFSVIKTSEFTKSAQYLKLKNSIHKKIQEYKLHRLQKKEEIKRLKKEQLERKRFEQEQAEIKRLEWERQRQEQERLQREWLRRQAFEKRAQEIERERFEREQAEIKRLEWEKQRQEQERLQNEWLKKQAFEKRAQEIERETKIKNNVQKPNTPKQKTKYNPNNKRYKCLDGDLVKSKIEREIDDFFFINDITHYYEFEYYNVIRQKKCKPDFYLPKSNLYIEYFGMNHEGYNKSKAWKLELYSTDKYTNFEFLYPKDDKNLYDKLEEICRKYNIPLKGERK